jgi:Protein of unknown function (DUF3574)
MPPVVLRRSRLAWVFCAVVTLAGCSTRQPTAQVAGCPASQGVPMLEYELFFGRSIQGRADVSDQAWDEFLDRVVTPNLPNGYTVFDGAGAWLNPATGRTVHEATKILLVALPDAAASAAAVARIRAAYAEQFHQALVGMTTEPVCASF